MNDPKSSSLTEGFSLWAVFLIFIGSVAVAFMPNTTKLAYQSGANTETLIMIRSVTGMILLGGLIFFLKASLAVPRKTIVPILITGSAHAGMNYTFYTALQDLDISLSILILFTHPFLIAFFYHFVGTTRLTAFRIFWGVAAFGGLGLALSVSPDAVSTRGVLFASGASVLAAIMVVTMMKVSRDIKVMATNFYLSVFTAVLFTLLLLTVSDVQLPQTTLGWISCTGNGVAFIVAYLTFLAAAKIIGVARASVLTFMEPITTILLAAAIFSEWLTLTQWGGVAIVALGLIVMEAPKGTFSKFRKSKE